MASMKDRYLAAAVQDLCFESHKMALVSGPRQCGKTTFAKMLLRARKAGIYRNWDDIEFQRVWAKTPSAIIPEIKGKQVPLVVLDEIHKHHRWKSYLKGIYDTLEAPCDILVTGSARLNIYRRHSDSLLGRHFNFRLHPFSAREIERPDSIPPDEVVDSLFSQSLRRRKKRQDDLSAFMEYGPFPEPFLKQDTKTVRIWRRNREQLVIREDLRDISRLPELGQIEMMAALLPDRVGSLFSLTSIREDLLKSIPTIKRWLAYLKEVYLLFEIKPYGKRIPRSLKKEGKVYLWDYSGIKDKARRFENLVACHLLKACHFWTDTGIGDFDLFFVRNKEKQEIDFLVVRDGKPWLPVEVKLNDAEPSPSWRKFAPLLPCKRGLQIVYQPHWKIHEYGEAQILVAGAAEALAYFV